MGALHFALLNSIDLIAALPGGLEHDLKKSSDGKLDRLSKNFQLYDKTRNVWEGKEIILIRAFKTMTFFFDSRKINRKLLFLYMYS